MADTGYSAVVVGMGVAGHFRVRDLLAGANEHESMENVKVKGYVSRRELQGEKVNKITLDDALNDPEVNMIVISTESNQHESVIRQALKAKKHVCCEFPMTLSASSTTELVQLAKDQGVTLYENCTYSDNPPFQECIQEYKNKLATGAKMTSITVELTGKFNNWSEKFEKGGTPFMSSIDNIYQMMMLLGELTPEEAFITREDDEIVGEAKLVTVDGNQSVILRSIRRSSINRRGKTFKATFDDGSELDIVLASPSRLSKGGYMRDAKRFVETVKGIRDNTEAMERTLKGMQIAQELSELAKTNAKSINYS